MQLNVELPPDALDEIARRAAEMVVQIQGCQASPWLNAEEAANYLRCTRQRIYDLCSSGRLRRYNDGTRLLVSRDDIDSMLGAHA